MIKIKAIWFKCNVIASEMIIDDTVHCTCKHVKAGIYNDGLHASATHSLEDAFNMSLKSNEKSC